MILRVFQSYIFTIITGRNAILQGICPQVFGLFTVKLAGREPFLFPKSNSTCWNEKKRQKKEKEKDCCPPLI